jgi:hypothetical protein
MTVVNLDRIWKISQDGHFGSLKNICFVVRYCELIKIINYILVTISKKIVLK